MAATRKLGRPQVPSRFRHGPRTPGRAGTGMGRNSVAVELNHPAAATVILGNAPALGPGVLDPHTSQETRIQAEGQAQRAAPSSPAFRGAPPRPAPGGPPQPGPRRAWVCACRGSTYFVTGALGFVVAAGRHSLGGWRRHCSPGAGAHSPVPQLQHLPLPRGRGGLLRHNTRTARRVSPAGLPSPRGPALHAQHSRGH